MNSVTEQKLTELLQPIVEGLGFELWGCQYLPQGKHSVLRVFIDGENGVSLDDCGMVSAQVSTMLDAEDPLRGQYSLEVSSPGMDRLLFTIEQCERYLGQEVQIRLDQAISGKRKWKGALLAVKEGRELLLKCDDQEVTIPFENINRANLSA